MCETNDYALQKLIQENQAVLTKKQKSYLKLKRVIDCIASLIALIVLCPVILIVAIMIKLDAPKEKVIFKQERIGQNMRPFMLYKFRSMKTGSPELGTSEFVDADKYITKIGSFLRKTSLDELPQLWCCVVGTMSLTGPRPLLKREESMHFLRNYYGIYQVKPGITGLAQINGRDELNDYEKARWDRAYAHNVSFSLDCQILWKTVMKVLKHEGVVDDSSKKKEWAKDTTVLGESAYERTEQLYDDEVRIVK